MYGNGYMGVTEANYSVVMMHLITCAIRQAALLGDLLPGCPGCCGCCGAQLCVWQMLFCCSAIPLSRPCTPLPLPFLVSRPQTWLVHPFAALMSSSVAQALLPGFVTKLVSQIQVRRRGPDCWRAVLHIPQQAVCTPIACHTAIPTLPPPCPSPSLPRSSTTLRCCGFPPWR